MMDPTMTRAHDDVPPLRAAGFYRRLRAAREARALSRRELGQRADLSHTQVQNLESGEHESPGIVTAERLARALAVPVIWLAYNLGDAPADVVLPDDG